MEKAKCVQSSESITPNPKTIYIFAILSSFLSFSENIVHELCAFQSASQKLHFWRSYSRLNLACQNRRFSPYKLDLAHSPPIKSRWGAKFFCVEQLWPIPNLSTPQLPSSTTFPSSAAPWHTAALSYCHSLLNLFLTRNAQLLYAGLYTFCKKKNADSCQLSKVFGILLTHPELPISISGISGIDYQFLVITDQFENITIGFSDIDLVCTNNLKKNSKKSIFLFLISIIDFWLLLIKTSSPFGGSVRTPIPPIPTSIISHHHCKTYFKNIKKYRLSIFCDHWSIL